MKRNILVLVMLAISMVGLTACQTKNDQMVQSPEAVLGEETCRTFREAVSWNLRSINIGNSWSDYKRGNKIRRGRKFAL